MIVRHILDAKGHDVVTIAPGETVARAAQALREHRIGALVCLTEDGTVLGIMSERDVVRCVAEGGAEGLSASVEAFMTREITIGNEEMEIDEAMEVMTHKRFRHLPICREGKLVGIVSIGDAVKQRIEDVTREADYMRTYIHTS